jgi:hypothetical protein
MTCRSLFLKIASLLTARHIDDPPGSAASVNAPDRSADLREGADADQAQMERQPRSFVVAIVAVELLVAYLALFEPACWVSSRWQPSGQVVSVAYRPVVWAIWRLPGPTQTWLIRHILQGCPNGSALRKTPRGEIEFWTPEYTRHKIRDVSVEPPSIARDSSQWYFPGTSDDRKKPQWMWIVSTVLTIVVVLAGTGYLTRTILESSTIQIQFVALP